MGVEQAIPLLAGIVAGMLLSVIVWSVITARRRATGAALDDVQAQVLFCFLLVAVFSAGVFITCLLLRL